METPILFIIFNRPDTTERVFAEIRKIQPKKLFVAADGPRQDNFNDIENTKKARQIISQIDWPCDVQTLFSVKNLGCKKGVTAAIDWFFSNVEEGIILEDDCLPSQSFFPFCENLLNHFRNEKRVAMISGYNINEKSDSTSSYVFSRYGHIWGWATWKRAWQRYDVRMSFWANKTNQKKIKRTIGDIIQWKYRSNLYNDTFLGRKDTWDYQWEACRLLDSAFSIVPSVNLIENIGFGANATHTKQESSPLCIPANQIDFPLSHNTSFVADDTYDKCLRPNISIQKLFMKNIKDQIKKRSKDCIPPFLYSGIRKLLTGQKKMTPVWNTLSYEPMKGVEMLFDPSGSWQKKMVSGTYDSFLFERLKTIGIKGKVVYDIGAHVGYHSLYFAKLAGPQGKVYSFEPNQKNVDRFNVMLQRNHLQKNVTVFPVAVSKESGVEEFTLHDDIESGRSSGNFLEQADTFQSKHTYLERGFVKSEVKTVPIDNFQKELGIKDLPDIIKLDVEGAEYLVLQGARETILKKRPTFFIEIHSMANMFNVLSFLFEMNYTADILKKESNGVCFIEARPKE